MASNEYDRWCFFHKRHKFWCIISVRLICLFVSEGLAETRNELYQVINNFFFIPFVNFGQAPLKNFQEGVNFFETAVSLGTKKNSKTYFV